jgi:hypothetical protein
LHRRIVQTLNRKFSFINPSKRSKFLETLFVSHTYFSCPGGLQKNILKRTR